MSPAFADRVASMSAQPRDVRAELLETAAAGVYLQNAPFQALTAAVADGFGRLVHPTPHQRVQGGAVMAMADLARSAYVDRFPQLVAAITPRIASAPGAAETAMTPAACLSLYPLVAARGPLGPEGLTIAVSAPCHRTEESYGPTRLRAFTMNEWVFFGRADQTAGFVEHLRGAVTAWLGSLDLRPLDRTANDPFFGRGAEVMAGRQRALQTKVEIVLPIGEVSEVACLSFNRHGEFFSQRWDIVLREGGWAHSACVGVGLERLALALIDRHGDRLDLWPDDVRAALFGPLR